MSKKPFVAIVMGSDSDKPTLENTFNVLKKFNVDYEVRITSAHRTPEYTKAFINDAEDRGCEVFIAAAGLAAHLAGAVASHSVKPVIGIPINAALNGLDSLLSTVQMPGGIPVATVAIGNAGAKNAAYLAVQILATNDSDLKQALLNERAENAKAILAKND
jgi:5-(carboxyamino)imidazole ribonucleotide mutase